MFRKAKRPTKKFSVFRKIEASPQIAVHGQVNTKDHVVDLILDLAGYTGPRVLSTTLLDPGCGEGAFLLAAARRLVRASKTPVDVRTLATRLVGIEKDDEQVEACRERVRLALADEGLSSSVAARLSQQWIIAADFLELALDRKFDLIVGNPPYVRQEAIPKALVKKYRERFQCFHDRADLYVAFFEKALTLLGDKGTLGFICPNRFTKNSYGKKLRSLISGHYCLRCIIDLPEASPFATDVLSYPGIYIVDTGTTAAVDHVHLAQAEPKECQAVKTLVLTGNANGKCSENGNVTHHRYDRWFDGEEKWAIESPRHLQLLRRLEAENVQLGADESGCRVGIGVATGADNVFIVQAGIDVEPELLLPLVMTKDLAPDDSIRWHKKYVINPFLKNKLGLIELAKYPRAQEYFAHHRARLEARHVAKRDPRAWYRTIDRIHARLVKTPKLLIPDIKASNKVAYDDGRFYPHHNLYYVVSDLWDLRALRTILRSSVARFFVSMYGIKMHSNFFRFQAQYLRHICVPSRLTVPEQEIDRLILAGETAESAKIDEAAARLYGLTDKEFALIAAISGANSEQSPDLRCSE
jgi:tRNA1(Val) A37 N6-methylase TrmN6